MLKRIEFENFKRLRRFTLSAKPGNIIVGPNNSGKSSILDALRLLEACDRFAQRKKPKIIQNNIGVFDGYDVPISNVPFPYSNITTDYDSDDAKITFLHVNGTTAHIWLHPDRVVRYFVDAGGKRLNSIKKFRQAFPVSLVIVPTLSPLESEERFVKEETVQKNRATRLAARNFRNIWYLEDHEKFLHFKEKVERAWPGIILKKPELVRGSPAHLNMYYEENRITREIQWAGYGFQIWLQIHTHLLRANADSILVIDEPDIYLHPDLQHRLYHDIKEKVCQYFMATHATEIINEADTTEILLVDASRRHGRRIKSDADYDMMLDHIGSAENADFAKLSKVKKLIFVEGDDEKIIRKLAKRLSLQKLQSDREAPIFRLGGFAQSRRAKETVWAFSTLLDVDLDVICLFDRDYRSAEEIEKFTLEMRDRGIMCFVLDQKEIENFLIVPAAIARAFNAKSKTYKEQGLDFSESEVVSIIEQCADDLKIDTLSHVVANCISSARKSGDKRDTSTIIAEAQTNFENTWATVHGKLKLAPGKTLLKKVLFFIKESKGVSLSVNNVVDQIKEEDLSSSFVDMLKTLEKFCGR